MGILSSLKWFTTMYIVVYIIVYALQAFYLIFVIC